MKKELNNLAEQLKAIDLEAAEQIRILAGRYDKAPTSAPPSLQPAFKYIMYLKLMRGIDDSTFHYMKRKYLDTSPDIQRECQEELDKIISQDSLKTGISSAEIRRKFQELLPKFQAQFLGEK